MLFLAGGSPSISAGYDRGRLNARRGPFTVNPGPGRRALGWLFHVADSRGIHTKDEEDERRKSDPNPSS
jgi:hypothetical protein